MMNEKQRVLFGCWRYAVSIIAHTRPFYYEFMKLMRIWAVTMGRSEDR
jgi:hypothetical protein